MKTFRGIVIFLLLPLAAGAALYVFGDRLTTLAARAYLRDRYSPARTSLSSAKLRPDRLTVSGLAVRYPGNELNIGSASVRFDPESLLRGKLGPLSVSARDLSLTARTNTADLSRLLNGSKPVRPDPRKRPLGLTAVEISGFSFDIRNDELSLKGRLSGLKANVAKKRVLSLDASIESAEYHGLIVKDGSLTLGEANPGLLTIAELRYQKLGVNSLRAPAEVLDNTLVLVPMTGVALDGQIRGRASVVLSGNMAYSLEIDLEKLNAPALLHDLEFEEKMSMTGLWLGKILVEGDASGIRLVEGSLNALSPGGDLVIRDETFLQNIAERMRQPLSLVEAGLREYHYDTAGVGLRKTGHDLSLDLELNGQKGKRRLELAFHDIF